MKFRSITSWSQRDKKKKKKESKTIVKSVMDTFCSFAEWSKKMQLLCMTLLKETKNFPISSM